MNELTYRKKLSMSIAVCVAVVIICVGMLSGSAYRQHTYETELEEAKAALSAAQQENENRKEQLSILESQKLAAEEEISRAKATETEPSSEKKTEPTSENRPTTPTTTKKTEKETEKEVFPPTQPGDKKVYLTFDDGPSKHTPQILKILKEKNAKATFFVINRPKYNHYMKDIVSSGNAIALHSYSHDYKKIYSSDENFYNDLNQISELVKKETGVTAKVTRFPGGSSNTVSKKYNPGIISRVSKGIQDKGYRYFDWNCSNGDAKKDGIPAAQLVQNVKRSTGSQGGNLIVLMHDTDAKGTTVEALPEIIDFYRSKGFTFEVITEKTPPVHHKIAN